jgi:plasmid stability protein
MISFRQEASFMPAVTVRNLSEETHRALKLRAARNGRSTEAEIRQILDAAVVQARRVGIGTALAAVGKRHGGITLSLERGKMPVDAASFE